MVAATALSPARALRQPRRLDVRALVGVLLMLAATGGAIVAWTAAEDTRPIVVAAHDLPSGAILSSSDLVTRRVRVDDSIYAAAVPGADLNAMVGRQLAEPVHADQILARAQVASKPAVPAGQEVLTVPVRADNAAGGHLRAGDVVQVLATVDAGKTGSHTTVILPQATIYDVGRDAQSAGSASANTTASGSDSSAPVTWASLIVTPDQAVQLANARWNADLDVALVPAQAQGQQ
jgi:Flp pilus assembly protein CpaB